MQRCTVMHRARREKKESREGGGMLSRITCIVRATDSLRNFRAQCYPCYPSRDQQ